MHQNMLYFDIVCKSYNDSNSYWWLINIDLKFDLKAVFILKILICKIMGHHIYVPVNFCCILKTIERGIQCIHFLDVV